MWAHRALGVQGLRALQTPSSLKYAVTLPLAQWNDTTWYLTCLCLQVAMQTPKTPFKVHSPQRQNDKGIIVDGIITVMPVFYFKNITVKLLKHQDENRFYRIPVDFLLRLLLIPGHPWLVALIQVASLLLAVQVHFQWRKPQQ